MQSRRRASKLTITGRRFVAEGGSFSGYDRGAREGVECGAGDADGPSGDGVGFGFGEEV